MDARDGNEKCGMPPEYVPPPLYNIEFQSQSHPESATAAAAAAASPSVGAERGTITAAVPPQAVTVIVARPPALKSVVEAYLLWFPLGLIGLHHFYLRRYAFGVLYLFTLGMCGVGWLVDGLRMPLLVKETNRKIQRGASGHRSAEFNGDDDDDASVSIIDAYILWFPLGLIGLHHYYLRRPAWGVAYTFTLGMFGIGWLIDAFRMPCLVAEANERLLQRQRIPVARNVLNAYVLGATPAGLFGAHHFYLGRIAFGVYYMLTLGGFAIGWIVDWFRMPVLVERANNPGRYPLGTRHKHLDDAYVMAIPAGFLGLHHFYLERPGWGVLYLFTGGLFGVGWLVDLCRMPCLVAETNKRLQSDAQIMQEIRQQMGGGYIVTDRSNVVVRPPYASPPAAVHPHQPHAVIVSVNPSMYGGPAAAGVNGANMAASPPPYIQSSPAAHGTPSQPLHGQPPAYTAYGSTDETAKQPL